MKGYIANIEQETLDNEFFRKVLYTDEKVQLVVMSLLPEEEIGEEVHNVDQFIRIEKGEGKAVLDGEEYVLNQGSVTVVPSGVKHNIVNVSSVNPLKLHTLYSPPNHAPGTIHKTKAEAETDEQD
jgi:mannose-6-phosphate isomerase-like protein (cupin superfamily)